jgi:hypothetical protein
MTTPTITDYPADIPAKGQSNPVFDANIDAYYNWLSTLNIPELQILTPWMAGIRDEVAATAMSGTLPTIAGKAGNWVRVNAGETAMEFRTPAQAVEDLGLSGGIAALTPAATVDIDLTANDHFTLTMDQNTTFTMSNVKTVDTFSLQLTGYTVTSAPYDLSAAVFDDKVFYTSREDTQLKSAIFNGDGTTMYTLDGSDFVFQYSLETPWEVNTAVYTGRSFDHDDQTTGAGSLFINSDETRLYISASYEDAIFQYNISTAGDVSTAVYEATFSVLSQDDLPQGVFLSSDGLIMYVVGRRNYEVYQYTLSTAGDISTASYASKSMDFSSEDVSMFSIYITPDGLKLFMYGITADRSVYEYDLSTAWDVSTGSYSGNSFATGPELSNGASVTFGKDGSKMYASDSTLDKVVQYAVDGSVYATTTYPAAFDFPSGIVPPVPVGGVKNLLDFVTTDGGTTWYGTQIGEDYK